MLGARVEKFDPLLFFHEWDPSKGVLSGARGRKVGSIQRGIIGGQGPKSGVCPRGYYWGPRAKKWGPFKGVLLGHCFYYYLTRLKYPADWSLPLCVSKITS